MNKIIDGKWVDRFSLSIRIAHWTHAVSFIMLVFTALPIYTETFRWIFRIFGGAENTEMLHRTFGLIFIFPTLFILLTDQNGFRSWTKQILSWKKHDFEFFTEFPKEFMGKKANVPKQDFYNAGQKVNSLLTIFFSAIMVCSGLIMWFKDYFPKGLVVWMYPLHSLGAALLIAVIIGHVYLSIGHPASRPSFRGMTKGSVDIEYAKAHHGRWYDEVKEEAEKEKAENN